MKSQITDFVTTWEWTRIANKSDAFHQNNHYIPKNQATDLNRINNLTSNYSTKLQQFHASVANTPHSCAHGILFHQE
jgi:hypothetical protein